MNSDTAGIHPSRASGYIYEVRGQRNLLITNTNPGPGNIFVVVVVLFLCLFVFVLFCFVKFIGVF